MPPKNLCSGLRTVASHSRTSSPRARSLATTASQTTQTRAATNRTSLRPLSQHWLASTPSPQPSTLLSSLPRRAYSSTPPAPSSPPPPNTPKQPSYELTFTCVPCGSRSAHTISKQGYHHGSILITCPSCRNRHVISDHLQIFGPDKITVEELVKKRGQLVKRGTLGEDGDLEFWEDGTTTLRNERQGEADGQDPKAPVRKERGDEPDGEGQVAGSTFGKS
ncbi:unnamed protein product [Discula destructiva]